jgi:hypothetical protein
MKQPTLISTQKQFDDTYGQLASGYSRTPFTPTGTILKVKQWKSKTQYDLMLKEQFAKEAEVRRATNNIENLKKAILELENRMKKEK